MDKSPGYGPPRGWNHWTITDCCNALLITCNTALHSMQRWRLGADALPISPSSTVLFGPSHLGKKILYHKSVLAISLLRHVLRADIHGVQRQREQTPQEKRNRQVWNVRHQENDTNWVMVALSWLFWSIYLCFRYFDRFRTLSCNFHPASSSFPPSIPIFFKLSTKYQPAITRIKKWAFLQGLQGLQFNYTLIRAISKISAYTKTVQFYSTKNTSMNKLLAQSSSPCLMLGGIPPASLSEGWTLEQSLCPTVKVLSIIVR